MYENDTDESGKLGEWKSGREEESERKHKVWVQLCSLLEFYDCFCEAMFKLWFLMVNAKKRT